MELNLFSIHSMSTLVKFLLPWVIFGAGIIFARKEKWVVAVPIFILGLILIFA
jgi:hypothetical protein